MPSSPVMENTESKTAGESHRSTPTPFLTKTYQIVDDETIDDIISWNDCGSSFVVWNPTVFARDLLPKYFKHNNFSSFVRQLNTYGFKKVVPDRWEFSNDCFRKGEKRLLGEIHRRKISPAPAATLAAPFIPLPKRMISPSSSGEEQVVNSNSSPSQSIANADLVTENEKLRKENVHLYREVSQVKNLCNNIFTLLSNYSISQSESGFLPSNAATEIGYHSMGLFHAKENHCDDNETDEMEMRPKLFGVPIGVKRARYSVEETAGYGRDGNQLDSLD